LAGQYPLQLLSCKTRERLHSQFGNLSWIRGIERARRLDINPVDAAPRGLATGDPARLRNGRGAVLVEVHVTPGIRPGVVHVIEGRCTESDAAINTLTEDGSTDMNHGATYYECLVEVERA
jgi:anaerobic selenocysteine-containing dehydrogenase